MKDRMKKIGLWLGALATVFLCCGAGYLLSTALWNALGTVVQQWVLGALAFLAAYYVIGLVFGVLVIAGAIILLATLYSKYL